MLLLLALLAVVFGQFDDSTCKKVRSTRAEMKEFNHAKMFTLGNYTCNSTFITYDSDGSVGSTSTSRDEIVFSKYDAFTGSVRSIYYPVGGLPPAYVDEYADPVRGGACIEVTGDSSAGYYTQSLDQNKGGLGTTYRSIGYYTKDAKKTVVGITWFVPKKDGYLLSLSWINEDQEMEYSVLQRCVRV